MNPYVPQHCPGSRMEQTPTCITCRLHECVIVDYREIAKAGGSGRALKNYMREVSIRQAQLDGARS